MMTPHITQRPGGTMRTRHLLAVTAALLLALTACSTSTSTSDDKPSASPTSASPTSAKAYTFKDCVALLEYDYQQDDLQDASGDPECSHLTSDEYQDAVAEVLTAHKDEIIEQSN